MDLFYDSLPFAARRRAHFHHFMAEVHVELNRVRSEQRPAEIVAQRFARRVRVLCLDELQVSDIGDAMLLHGLFAGLIDAGVTLVITSNRPPDELYKDGLQRVRFLPAIALLQQQLEVHELGGANDYRLRQLQSAPVYFVGAPAATEPELTRVFDRLAGDNRDEEPVLTLMGRRVNARRRAKDVVWFDFQTLCQGARSQNDYVELAVAFTTVVLSDVPVIDTGLDDAGRRFIALVDEFYDQGVKLVLSAAATPAELYQGERLRFEFQRTASRLVEMQSTAYLARPHGR
jgi:cell division protein ZapE